MAVTVLVVGNDKATTESYASLFNKKEYTVLTAHSGRQALAQAKSRNVDAVVVDVTSTRLNCKNLCRKLRSETAAPLIAIASATTKLDSAVTPAAIVPKPVTAKKLISKVRLAIDNKPPRLMKIGYLSLDLEKRKLARGSKAFSLTPKEFLLLKLFVSKMGQIVTRKMLMREVWETDYLGDTRTLDVHIRWLREKIEDNASKPQHLLTVRGQGYRFVIT